MRAAVALLTVVAVMASVTAVAQTIRSKMTLTDGSCCAQFRDRPVTRTDDKHDDVPVFTALRERAFREGFTLKLQIDGDRTLEIANSRNAGGNCDFGFVDCRIHQLSARWPEQRYYVVEVYLWEGSEAYLISARDGDVTPVFAPPVLSPSGRLAIANDYGIAYGKGLQLIDMSKTPPAVQDIESPACPGAGRDALLTVGHKLKWLDNERIVFEEAVSMSMKVAIITLRIVDGKPQWECQPFQ